MAAGDPIKASDSTTIAQASTLAPIVRLIQQVVQAVAASSVDTAITFGSGSEDIDTDGFHDTTTNTSRITPTVAGYFELSGVYSSASNASSMGASIGKNGTRVPSGQLESVATADNRGIVTGPVILTANGSTDYFELYARQGTAGTVNTFISGQFACILQCKY